MTETKTQPTPAELVAQGLDGWRLLLARAFGALATERDAVRDLAERAATVAADLGNVGGEVAGIAVSYERLTHDIAQVIADVQGGSYGRLEPGEDPPLHLFDRAAEALAEDALADILGDALEPIASAANWGPGDAPRVPRDKPWQDIVGAWASEPRAVEPLKAYLEAAVRARLGR